MKYIANSFNKYFSNIGPSLSEKIDMSGNDMTYNDYLTNPVHSQFSFSPVSEKETLNIISKLKNKKSYGIDGISNVLLKSIANEIIKPPTLIINQSLLSKQSVPFSRHLLSFWLRICVCGQSGTHTTSFSFRLGDLVTF